MSFLRAAFRLSTLLCVLGLSAGAWAHTAGTISHSRVSFPAHGTVTMELEISPADFRQWPEASDPVALAEKIVRATTLRTPERICTTTTPIQHDADSFVTKPTLRFSWELECEGEAGQIDLEWLADLSGHLHLLRMHDATQLLRGGASTAIDWRRDDSQITAWHRVLGQQFRHGITHIAGGWDHLAFLLGLMLLATRLSMLAVLITGFTLGHTGSLLPASLGRLLPPSSTIELAIAASIVFIGLPGMAIPRTNARWAALLVIVAICLMAALLQPADSLLWAALALIALSHRQLTGAMCQEFSAHAIASLALAMVFGLLHGFGFASAVLSDAENARELWPILLGFNLGVETGQLLFVIPAWALLHRLWKRGPETTTALLRAVVLGIGGFALTTRLLGS